MFLFAHSYCKTNFLPEDTPNGCDYSRTAAVITPEQRLLPNNDRKSKRSHSKQAGYAGQKPSACRLCWLFTVTVISPLSFSLAMLAFYSYCHFTTLIQPGYAGFLQLLSFHHSHSAWLCWLFTVTVISPL